MNDGNAKQQIVEKIKSNSNILVTVSTNPSVDELSAALGLTLLLNKMNKHATAVFSGQVPPAITFLDPEKTFENTVDSLRDFIIALDKEKADHLRYKVEGDVVKIFITPYRTTITGDDLDYSQGDYNVELVLALGVKNRENLDDALSAHGRILHDATVVTFSAGGDVSELGSIDWREDNASSLSEMLVSLSDALRGDKALLDEQIATAFLTGIVAATDRFSNKLTSSKVMTIAAQLMAAGANQQLIASKLEEAHEIGNDVAKDDTSSDEDDGNQNSDGTIDLSEGQSTRLNKKQNKKNRQQAAKPVAPKRDDGSLTISHEKEGDIDEVAEQTEDEMHAEAAQHAEDRLTKQAQSVPAQDQEEAAKLAEKNLADQLATTAPAAVNTLSVADLQQDLAAASAEVDEAAEQPPASLETPPLRGAVSSEVWKDASQEPMMGGTLNATTEQAADDARRAREDERNRTILSHNNNTYVGDSSPIFQSPFNAASQKEVEPAIVDPMTDTTPSMSTPMRTQEPSPSTLPPLQTQAATLADLDQQNRAPHDEARAAVEAAFSAPAEPQAAPAPPFPPMPDFSTLPPELPQMMPPTDFNNTIPGLPPENLGTILPPAANTTPSPATDPGQFKIPGQS